jgi:hypothetical protein
MIYKLLADILLVIHFCFIVFVICGGFFVLRWRFLWKLHIPAVVWSFLVQYFVWICPLTLWENRFRTLSGESGYENGFIEYFFEMLIYPDLPLKLHIFLAFALLLVNILIYFYIFFRPKKLI